MASRVLIATINNYPSTNNDLQGCNNDGKLWHDFFLEQGAEVTWLQDFDANPKNILGVMDEFAAKSKSGDFAAHIHSGHGSGIADITPKDEIDGQDEVVCVVSDDGRRITYISDDQFYDKWKKFKVGVRKFSFWDSCFSGGGSRDASNINDMVFNQEVEEVHHGLFFNPRYLDPAEFLDDEELVQAAYASFEMPIRTDKSRGGALVLSAAGSHEYAYETSDANGKIFGAGTVAAIGALGTIDIVNDSYTDWHRAILKRIEGQTPYLDGTKHQRYEWEILRGRTN